MTAVRDCADIPSVPTSVRFGDHCLGFKAAKRVNFLRKRRFRRFRIGLWAIFSSFSNGKRPTVQQAVHFVPIEARIPRKKGWLLVAKARHDLLLLQSFRGLQKA
jgi:hypothetical protein